MHVCVIALGWKMKDCYCNLSAQRSKLIIKQVVNLAIAGYRVLSMSPRSINWAEWYWHFMIFCSFSSRPIVANWWNIFLLIHCIAFMPFHETWYMYIPSVIYQLSNQAIYFFTFNYCWVIVDGWNSFLLMLSYTSCCSMKDGTVLPYAVYSMIIYLP